MDCRHPSVIEFVSASEEISAYFKADTCEPPEVSQRFKAALQGIRDYLDAIDIKMPPARFPYDHEDKKTWKYLGVTISGDKTRGKKFVRDIPNPDWMYRK